MRCPNCSAVDTRVVDSRPADEGSAIRRRRECEKCESRFTTYERFERVLMVRKRSGELEPFDPAKLSAGVGAALADRLGSAAQVADLVASVGEAVQTPSGIVGSEEIGRQVLGRLRTFDEAAYLRFASVYKDFSAAEDFEREVAALESAPQ